MATKPSPECQRFAGKGRPAAREVSDTKAKEHHLSLAPHVRNFSPCLLPKPIKQQEREEGSMSPSFLLCWHQATKPPPAAEHRETAVCNFNNCHHRIIGAAASLPWQLARPNRLSPCKTNSPRWNPSLGDRVCWKALILPLRSARKPRTPSSPTPLPQTGRPPPRRTDCWRKERPPGNPARMDGPKPIV